MIQRFFKSVLFAIFLLPAFCVWSQSEAVTKSGSINIVREVKPPILQLQGQIVFNEPSGNRAIDANERCSLRLTVKNTGMGDGFGLTGKIRAIGQVPSPRHIEDHLVCPINKAVIYIVHISNTTNRKVLVR